MAFKSISITLTVLSFAISTAANAAVITHGNLTTDDTTDYITDTSSGRTYKRFDTFDLTYADTLAAVGTGGQYEGWSIATSTIADDFYGAALSMATTPCTGAASYGTYCGTITGWSDGNFGSSIDLFEDDFWYLSTYTTPGRSENILGLGSITGGGYVYVYDDWAGPSVADSFFAGTGSVPLNALLYKDASVVPVPAAVWLFGSGLIGLIGLARRKKA